MNYKTLVTIESEYYPGQWEVHLPFISQEYDTLCGLAGMSDGEPLGDREYAAGDIHNVQKTAKGAKVNCGECIEIWRLCHDAPKSIMDLED